MTITEKASSLARLTTVKTILIVEDDASLREFLQQVIELETPYHALVAVVNIHALEVVQQVKPDLFLLDYYLDKKTGLDLYHHLHATDGLEDIPAIILSAGSMKHIEEIDDHRLLGMSKPFDLDELLTALAKLLEAPDENTI